MKSIDEKILEIERQLQEAKAEKERMELENPATIGARINKILKINGITQEEISKKTGIHRQSVSRYINDERKCPAETLGKIAKALDVSCDYLILGEMDESVKLKAAKMKIPEKCTKKMPSYDALAHYFFDVSMMNNYPFRETGLVCHLCGHTLTYTYHEERIYSIHCRTCHKVTVTTAANPGQAALKAGGVIK